MREMDFRSHATVYSLGPFSFSPPNFWPCGRPFELCALFCHCQGGHIANLALKRARRATVTAKWAGSLSLLLCRRRRAAVPFKPFSGLSHSTTVYEAFLYSAGLLFRQRERAILHHAGRQAAGGESLTFFDAGRD